MPKMFPALGIRFTEETLSETAHIPGFLPIES